MIEMIIVIVIIGILASVAIPKINAMKDAANASTCVHEVALLMQEIAAAYTGVKTFPQWTQMKLEDNVTNIKLNIGTRGNGIHNGNEIVHDNTIAYHCDGLKIIDIEPSTNVATGKYQIFITIVDSPTNASALRAANILEEQHRGLTRTFRM